VQECPVDLGCGGDVQAVGLAAAHLSAFLQRLPFGLAETLALVEMAGDLAGISIRTGVSGSPALVGTGCSGRPGSRSATAVRIATRLT